VCDGGKRGEHQNTRKLRKTLGLEERARRDSGRLYREDSSVGNYLPEKVEGGKGGEKARNLGGINSQGQVLGRGQERLH